MLPNSHILFAYAFTSLPTLLIYASDLPPTTLFCVFHHLDDVSHPQSSFYHTLASPLHDAFSPQEREFFPLVLIHGDVFPPPPYESFLQDLFHDADALLSSDAVLPLFAVSQLRESHDGDIVYL